MNITDALEALRYRIGDIGSTYEFSDAELIIYLGLATRTEGYETFPDVSNNYVPVVIAVSAYYTCIRMARILAEESDFKTSMDTDRAVLEVNRESLSKHYLNLASEIRKEITYLKYSLRKGRFGADLDVSADHDRNWVITLDKYGIDTTDYRDGVSEDVKF